MSQFQALFLAGSPGIHTSGDFHNTFSSSAQCVFTTRLLPEDHNNPNAVGLVGIYGIECRITAQLDMSHVLTIKSLEQPVFVLDTQNQLKVLTQVKAPSYGRQTVFLTALDSHTDQVRTFRLTFENNYDKVVVTLE